MIPANYANTLAKLVHNSPDSSCSDIKKAAEEAAAELLENPTGTAGGALVSMTVNGKTFTFDDRMTAEETVTALWDAYEICTQMAAFGASGAGSNTVCCGFNLPH